jgi:hypothetical protein
LIVYWVGFVLRISDGPIACSFSVVVDVVYKWGETITVVSENVVPVMVYKFNLSVNVSSPVGEIVSCRKIAICFTPKDILFDVGREIISCSGMDLDEISGVTWVKWMFQISHSDTGMKAFKMEDLLLLTIGEACLQ